MRPRLCAIVVLACSAAAQEHTLVERFRAAEDEAFARYREKDWPAAVAAFERQIAVYGDNPRPYYNVACCYALAGDGERAATWLRLSIARGWRDERHLADDPDLDSIRATDAYRACLVELARARARDPDPMPRRIPVDAVPSASAAGTILAASGIQERLLRGMEGLLDGREFNARLFQICDRRMAMLTRYLAENGDAKDADTAAYGRVQTAVLYLGRAGEDDSELQRVAAAYVVAMAEEFLRGWAGSIYLPEVLFWRAHAARRQGEAPEQVEKLLRTILADHPRSPVAPHVKVELCSLLADEGRREDLREVYADLESDENPIVKQLMESRLMKARLLAKGLPGSFPDHPGRSLYLVVASGDPESERALDRFRDRKPVVLCMDHDEAWLQAHAAGLETVMVALEPWLAAVPTLVVADGREVLAVDPTDDELRALGFGPASGE